ncbi:uncharacterized protein HMPREF1541_09622 [Cyphellophora europaea CBS 101466]|uniref:PXA domain-containing protein n=1 Tax=Cyphellophora europaea (strain CBS 101466) TaxID=1220924 RepID=W2SCY7_CYPE1|nr:uncharacterized protein HMPREF1541_09622 [Cyphellophora europaea CBS 101466]ETN45789.1 hypothetical protein HMPREF1541_09622 [Cyphellophora europaea CBS 101466]
MTAAPFQPTLKAPSTAQHSQLSALAGNTPSTSRATSAARPRKPARQESHSNDFLSDNATVSLIRRILVPDTHGTDRSTPAPIEALLPPLTSSNEVDIQLYAIIAVVVKDFISPWYTKITPDQSFVEEIVQIIAHCSRALEQRLRRVDVAQLALDEITACLERHVAAYHAANESHATLSYSQQPHHIYHSLNPHPALDPSLSPEDQTQAERTYRQLLVTGALAVLLPTEDVQNTSLRILVTDIIADLILGRAIEDRLCQPWFLHDSLSKIVATIAARKQAKATSEGIQADARSRLEKFGLLSAKTDASPTDSSPPRQSSIVAVFWSMLQWGYLAFLAVRFTTLGLMHARRLPARTRLSTKHALSEPSAKQTDDHAARLVLEYRMFPATSTILHLSRRMPWVAGALAFWGHVLTSGRNRAGGLHSILDRFLYHNIQTYLFPPSILPNILRNLRAVIFPNNSLGPPAPPPPTPEEALAIRKKAATDLLSLVPDVVSRKLFAPQAHSAVEAYEVAVEQVEAILDLLGDRKINKYLIYGILECIVTRLVPEILEKTPGELLEERGVVWDGKQDD